MAVDPTQLAEEQEARQRITAAGAPTEFAKGPNQEGIQIAAGGRFLEEGIRGLVDVFNITSGPSKSVSTPKRKPIAEASEARPITPQELQEVDVTTPPGRVAPRMPTPQEIGLVEDPGLFSERATQRALAPQMLSPEGVKRFEEQGFKVPKPGEVEEGEVLRDAQEALAREAEDQGVSPESIIEGETEALDIKKKAQLAATAEARGIGGEASLVDQDISDSVLDLYKAKEQNIKSLKEGGDFNFDYITTGDDVKAMITSIAELTQDATSAAKRGYVSNKATLRESASLLADDIGFSRELLNRKIGDRPFTAAEFVAGREILARSAKRLSELAEKITSKQATAEDMLKFRRQMALHSGIQMQLKGAQTEAARAVQSFQIPVSGELDAKIFSEEASRILSENGGEVLTMQLAKRLQRLQKKGGDRAVNEFTQQGYLAKTKQMVEDAYVAGLLSSPATQARAFFGTVSFMLYQLPEELIAGFYGSLIRSGRSALGRQYPIDEEQVYMEDVFLRVKGWADSYKDAMRAASVAFKTGMPAGGNRADVDVYTPDFRRTDNFFGRAIENVHKRLDLPFRGLLTTDEFMKTMSQRGEFYTLINQRYKNSMRQGKSHQEAIDDASMLMLNPRTVSSELDYKAKYDTMQTDLGKFGELVGYVQRTSFIGKFIMPFITAPTNSILRTVERSILSKTAKEALGGKGVTPKQQQLALGRLTMGAMTYLYMQEHVLEGRFTAGLPSSKAAREALPTGWLPYSYVSEGENWPTDENGEPLPLRNAKGEYNGPVEFYSITGFEPVAGIVAISADITKKLNQTDDPTVRHNIVTAAAAALGDYYKELPFLKGVADLYDDIGTWDLAKLAKSYAQNATPVGVPNPLSALQRSYQDQKDPRKFRPREDFVYYTIEDVEEQIVDEVELSKFMLSGMSEEEAKKQPGVMKLKYPDQFGRPNYDMVGLPKNDDYRWAIELMNELSAYQAQDSAFRDQEETNAIQYDSFGEVKGEADLSFSNNPVKSIISRISGIRMSVVEPLQKYESEVIDVFERTGRWPLRIRIESYEGLPLSPGTESDLIRIAKVTMPLDRTGYAGQLTFKQQLKALVTEKAYKEASYDERASLISALEERFLAAAFKALLENPKYANMKEAYLNRIELKDRQ